MNFWKIEGYDNKNKIFEKEVMFTILSENQLNNLLRALTSKASLEYEEIVGAYSKKKTKGHNDLLEVNFDKLNRTYSCGANPYFIARIVEKK